MNNLAFVFPGQGSQKVGMLAASHCRFAAVRDTFHVASERLGYDMWGLLQNGPQEALNLTETTQPVLLTASVALWRAWENARGAQPIIMAGHSLGEFSALVCAGALSFTDALELVRRRGEFMQTAVPVGQGAMAAVLGLDDSIINDLCAQVSAGHDGNVSAVNFNSPGQVVIAGHSAAVEVAGALLKEAGAQRVPALPVSAPFHTSLMRPAGDKLQGAITDIHIHPPRIPVVHNVNAMTETDPEKIRALLVEQIYSPVQWTACMAAIRAAGVEDIVECGPGKVLTGLARRIDKSFQCHTLEDPDAFETCVAAFK